MTILEEKARRRAGGKLPHIPDGEGTAAAIDALEKLIRLVALANSAQKDYLYSLDYRLGKWVSITRRGWVFAAGDPVDITGKDTRTDSPRELAAAICAMRGELAAIAGQKEKPGRCWSIPPATKQ